jgi:DNA-binding PadR family transcriptional regulator
MTPLGISAHLSKLEDAGYVEVTKEFLDRKPHTALALTKRGRTAFKDYRKKVKQFVERLPE